MKRPGKFPYLIPILFFCACAHAPAPNYSMAQPEILTAEGLAPFNVKDLAASRTAAVLDAQRTALKRAAELYMDDVSRAEDYAAFEAGPLKNPQNYLLKHKILSEGAEGSSYRVSLKTWVLTNKLAAALRGAGSGAPEGGLSAALVARETPEGSAFAAAYSAALSRRSIIRIADYPFTRNKAPADSDEALLSAAAAAGADVLLTASASAYASGAGLNTGFYPSRADGSVKVYDVRSGKLLLELSRQGSAIDSSQAAAFSKALATAGELLAQETALKADRLLKPDAVIRIKVYGLNGLETLEKLKSQLQRLDLKKLRLEKYSNGEAVFVAVPRRPDPQELASAVLRGDTIGLELEAASPQEVLFTAQ
ncbi:MAG TPA: hypothetical protein PKI19_11905 [Elusimicrobiales bacterium]|nr:hypothetical protein [Elusimicrobiales bacterium]